MNDPFARLPVVPSLTVTSTDVTDGQPLPSDQKGEGSSSCHPRVACARRQVRTLAGSVEPVPRGSGDDDGQ